MSSLVRRLGDVLTSADGLSVYGKGLVVVLSLWALLVVVPDAVRIVQPLGTLGFSANNDGYVYGVDDGGAAQKAGLREGDRLDLDAMSCWPRVSRCSQLLAVFGGMGGLQYVRPRSTVSLLVRAADAPPRAPARAVTMTARPEEHGPGGSQELLLWRLALAADELGALAFIACGAWLVWRRPATITAGFFLYALWFNPGQYFEFYSWLQGHPVALLVQETLQAVFQSFGYVGFLVLALFFPNNRARPGLAWAVAALPLVFVVLAALQLASFLNVFGVPTESITRASYIAGWIVDGAVLFYVLPAVLRDSAPEERARTKWLLTGCVAGLSGFIFADYNEATTMSPLNLAETTTNLLYFCNVLTLAAVVYTVRHHRVVNVRFAITRGFERLGLWALVTALGAFFIHRVDMELGEGYHLDQVAVSLGLIGVTLVWERLAEMVIELMDVVLFPRFRKTLEELRELARHICDATSIAHLERAVVDESASMLRISSAAVFRRHRSGSYRRRTAAGWDASPLREIAPENPLVTEHIKDVERPVRLRNARWSPAELPTGVGLPTVAVPVRAFGRLHAIVLYGAHRHGDDLNDEEIETLERLGRSAAVAYESIEAAALRRQVRALVRRR